MKARKTIAAASAALVFAFALCAACGCQPSSEEVIRATVTEEFDAYKNLDEKVLSELAATSEEEGLSELGISGEDFAKAVMGGFDYTINDITVEESKATVSVSITSKSKSDFESKLDTAVTSFVGDPATESLTTEEKNEQIGKIAMQAFEDTDAISEDVTLEFQLQGNTWTSTNANSALSQLDSLVFAN